jgi:hypothetical protein
VQARIGQRNARHLGLPWKVRALLGLSLLEVVVERLVELEVCLTVF